MAAAQSDIRTVRVHAERPYAAHVGHGLLARGLPGASTAAYSIGHAIIDAAQRINPTPPRRALLAFDDALPPSLVEALAASLRAPGLDVALSPLHADESQKSLASVERLLNAAIAAKLERADAFIALGGGIVGDLTGFAASIYRRGVPWCNIPTTLLAMVDASIGGKTGCNLAPSGALLKNMAGAFHDPALVICDTATLLTLPRRELIAGLGECVKHAMIEASVPAPETRPDASLWSRLEALATSVEASGSLRPDALVELIADNLALKARVVAMDPFETAPDAEGGRALLNLGHTFGHALETMEGLIPLVCGRTDPHQLAAPTDFATALNPPMAHGEAIALGLVAACVAGEALGTWSAAGTRRVEDLLMRLSLPTRVDNLSTRVDEALARLRHDKKSKGGSVRIIVPVQARRDADAAPSKMALIPEGIGASRVVADPAPEVLRAAFAYLANRPTSP